MILFHPIGYNLYLLSVLNVINRKKRAEIAIGVHELLLAFQNGTIQQDA